MWNRVSGNFIWNILMFVLMKKESEDLIPFLCNWAFIFTFSIDSVGPKISTRDTRADEKQIYNSQFQLAREEARLLSACRNVFRASYSQKCRGNDLASFELEGTRFKVVSYLKVPFFEWKAEFMWRMNEQLSAFQGVSIPFFCMRI